MKEGCLRRMILARGATVMSPLRSSAEKFWDRLTKSGVTKIEAAAPGHVRAVRELLFDALTGRDVAALAAIGRRVRPRLDPQDTLPHLR